MGESKDLAFKGCYYDDDGNKYPLVGVKHIDDDSFTLNAFVSPNIKYAENNIDRNSFAEIKIINDSFMEEENHD